MGESTKTTFNTQLIKDLKSEDLKLVKKALTKIKDKGNEKHIVPLVHLYENTSDENIKNEITKFDVTIVAIVDYSEEKFEKFIISKKGEYSVTNQYSQTLNNEK